MLGPIWKIRPLMGFYGSYSFGPGWFWVRALVMSLNGPGAKWSFYPKLGLWIMVWNSDAN